MSIVISHTNRQGEAVTECVTFHLAKYIVLYCSQTVTAFAVNEQGELIGERPLPGKLDSHDPYDYPWFNVGGEESTALLENV